MNLDDILNGSRVFVDANIIIYMLGRKSVQCRRFLMRCDSHAIEGWITTSVVAEVGHRRMMHEAQARQLISSNPARALAQKREIVRQLSIYAEEIRNLLGGGLMVETVRPDDFFVALELQKQHGLLTNDALNIATARRLGINEIATADAHFDRIQGIIVYKPDDLVGLTPPP
jgi:predicted nucleic acid-binding protein